MKNTNYYILLVAFFLLNLLTLYSPASAQQNGIYGNEWVTYNRPYYKFKIKDEGIYRISFAALSATALPALDAAYLHLYRDGQEVPLYTTANGVPATSDYIEFYGTGNTGIADTALYANPADQLHPELSLFSDTAVYFLTHNPNALGLRYDQPENILQNLPATEPYAWHTLTRQFSNVYGRIGSFMAPVDMQTSSESISIWYSDLEKGEGWGSTSILAGSSVPVSFGITDVATVSENAILSVRLLNRGSESTSFAIKRDNVPYLTGELAATTASNYIATFDASMLGIPQTSFTVENQSTNNNTEITAVRTSLRYPCSFTFGAKPYFNFELDNEGEKYIEIANFPAGGQPVLYDITNRMRLIPVMQNGSLRVKLPPSVIDENTRNLVLLNTAQTQSFTWLDSYKTVVFTNYNQAQEQGNYIIITHPSLQQGFENQVERYRAYRSSIEGGGYNAKIVNIDQLYDQFAYGIAHHPIAIRKFINYMLSHAQTPPQMVLLLGKAVTLDKIKHNTLAAAQDLVPTWGSTAADIFLAAANSNTYRPQLAIGRIPALAPQEVKDYLDKLIEYETYLDADCSTPVDTFAWRKNAVIIGNYRSTEPATLSHVTGLLAQYQGMFQSGRWGANIAKKTLSIELYDSLQLAFNAYSEGVGLLYYNSVNTPNNSKIDSLFSINNSNKYPFLITEMSYLANEAYLQRFGNNRYIDQLLFLPQRGVIGMVANTGVGLSKFARNVALPSIVEKMVDTQIGQPIGTIWKQAVNDIYIENPSTIEQKLDKFMAQTTTILTDPALVVAPLLLPNYHLSAEEVQFFNPETNEPLLSNPIFIDQNMEQIGIQAVAHNYGIRPNTDSISLVVQRIFPSGAQQIIWQNRIPAFAFRDTFTLFLPNNLLEQNGLNSFSLYIDAELEAFEVCELDNAVSRIAMVSYYTDTTMPTTIEKAIVVYPNPTAGKVHLIVPPSKGAYAQIFDVSGRVFWQKQINSLQETLDLDSLPRGIYILRVDIDGQQIRQQIVKQ